MTHIKKLSLLALLFTGSMHAQFVTTDVTQTAQNAAMITQNAELIKNSIEQFKQMKKIYDQGRESYKEFVQIKDFIANAEERLKNIGDIKQLRLNNINMILEKIFCIKQGNYFPVSLRFADIVAQIKSAFLNCDNTQVYNKTYSGVLQRFDSRINNASRAGQKEIIERMNELNKSLKQADDTRSVTNAYNSRMKLELGLKYKAISDGLMELSEELHLAINEGVESDKNIALSPGERLKMMDMANQYQLQAMELEEKSAQLLAEASELQKEQEKEILKMQRDLAMKQIINFKL